MKLEAKLKAEASMKRESSSMVEDMVKRGMTLRAQQKTKQELKSVKRESKGGKAGKKRKAGNAKRAGGKRKVSCAMREARREAMNREVPLSAGLAAVLGASVLSRPEDGDRRGGESRDNAFLVYTNPVPSPAASTAL